MKDLDSLQIDFIQIDWTKVMNEVSFARLSFLREEMI